MTHAVLHSVTPTAEPTAGGCFRTWFYISAWCLMLAAPASDCLAQALSDLKGLDQKQIEAQLGAPDERRGAGQGRESWLYGSSVLLFRDGVVTAWSDAGDLLGRKNITKVKKVDGEEEALPSSSLLWRNPWTPWQDVNAAQIVDEIRQRAEAATVGTAAGSNPASTPVSNE